MAVAEEDMVAIVVRSCTMDLPQCEHQNMGYRRSVEVVAMAIAEEDMVAMDSSQ